MISRDFAMPGQFNILRLSLLFTLLVTLMLLFFHKPLNKIELRKKVMVAGPRGREIS